MAEISVITRNNKIFGVYTNFENAIDYIYSCLQLKLVNTNDNIIINIYKENSTIIIKEIKIDLAFIITKSLTFNVDKYYSEYNIEFIENKSTTHLISEPVNNKVVSLPIEKTKLTSNELNEQRKQNKIISNEYLKNQSEIGQTKIDIMHNINLLKQQQSKMKEELEIFNNDLKLYNMFKENLISNPTFEIPFLFQTKFEVFKNLENKNKLDLNNFKLLYKKEKIITSYDNLFDMSQNVREDEYESDSDTDTDSDTKSDNNFSNESTEELLSLIN